MVPSKDLLPVFPFNSVRVFLFLFLAPSGFPRLARLKFLILTIYRIKNRKRKKN
jgi:hypothetical protein